MMEKEQAEPDRSFDQFANDYNKILGNAIAVSGESADYFVRIKVDMMRELLETKRITSGLRFLDYGCGTGRAFRCLDEVFDSPTYLGLDPSPESIRCARESVSDPRASFMPLDAIRQAGHSGCDVAFAAVVFHHIPPADRGLAVRDIFSALKPGGTLFIFEHNPLNPLTRKIVNECPFDKDAVLLRASEATQRIKDVGFIDVRTRYYFFFPKILSFLRPLEKYLGWNLFGGQYVVWGRRP